MDLKRNAAGRTPAASTTDADASKGKSHHTTKNSQLDVDLLLSRVNLTSAWPRAPAQNSGAADRNNVLPARYTKGITRLHLASTLVRMAVNAGVVTPGAIPTGMRLTSSGAGVAWISSPPCDTWPNLQTCPWMNWASPRNPSRPKQNAAS